MGGRGYYGFLEVGEFKFFKNRYFESYEFLKFDFYVFSAFLVNYNFGKNQLFLKMKVSSFSLR